MGYTEHQPQVNALVSKLVCILQKHGEVEEWWEKSSGSKAFTMAKLRKHDSVFFEGSLRPPSTETRKEVAFELLKCEISEEKLKFCMNWQVGERTFAIPLRAVDELREWACLAAKSRRCCFCSDSLEVEL
eukprot:m.104627 g.104627  ORF g.104627 m.104627 type:complete len:130 (+) comp37210_c0_seq1:2-391(+)